MPDYAASYPTQGAVAIPRLYASTDAVPPITQARVDRSVLMGALGATSQAIVRLYATATTPPTVVGTTARSVLMSPLNVPQLALGRLYVSQFFPTTTNAPRPRQDVGLLYPAQPS